MRTATKAWLITASSLVLIGCIIFAGIMTMLRWDFSKLSAVKYETNIHEIGEKFHAISIKTDTADIMFSLSDDEKCKVECHEEANAKHSVIAAADTLTIELINEKSLIDYIRHIGISFDAPKITVYLPDAEYTSLLISENTGDVKIPKDFHFENVDILLSTGNVDFYASASDAIRIRTSTGDIRAENISAASIDLSVTTGKVTAAGVVCTEDFTIGVSTGKAYLTDIACKNLTSGGNTGDISLKNVLAAEKFSIVRSTGDIKFDGCDAAEVFAETDTGDVAGTFLSGKVFSVSTDTGSIDVPQNTAGGMCTVKTNTGDIRLDIQ